MNKFLCNWCVFRGLLSICSAFGLLSWSAPALALPCLNSSTECLETLIQQAIEQSSEIEAINQQLELTAQRQDYAESRRWTNYLTLDPIRLVQNVLGGGDVQRDRIAIASLELETANLIRRREEVAESITREVIDLVLTYEKAVRKGELLASQLETQRQRVAVREAAYRTGHSSTESMLGLWQRTDNLEARCGENRIDSQLIVTELEAFLGIDVSYASMAIGPCADIYHYARSEPGRPSNARIIHSGSEPRIEVLDGQFQSVEQ